MLARFLTFCTCLALTGCGLWQPHTPPQGYAPHSLEHHNLHKGMTATQVKHTLGLPNIVPPHQTHVWYYVAAMPKGEHRYTLLKLTFGHQRLEQIELEHRSA